MVSGLVLDSADIPEPEQEMGFLVMEALAVLLNSNSQNAGHYYCHSLLVCY